ncbi:MAG TPA: hypothetical protein VK327_04680 [Candidatus Paceibacterota bacterium]|nr:hypothetical protein [Candidatus Paceibacterota bacterium]
MKTSSRKAPNSEASVLVVTLVITLILGVMLASYFGLVQAQSRSVARSQLWNNAMIVAEAGVEDGLQFLNKYIGTPYLTAWSAVYSADGWSRPGGGNVYKLTRYMNADHSIYYTVYVTNVNNAPVIRASGYVPAPAWAAGGQPISRTVVVRTRIDAMFNVCMAALGTIDLKGNGVASDSYDSSDLAYSTNGLYIKSKRKAGGDIVTNNTITNSVLNIGNANVAGHVTTGPNGTIQQGPNDTVGDLAWVDANTPGIKPGWSGNDLNVVFNNVVLPNVSWFTASGVGTGGSGTAPDGKSYDHIFTSPFDTMISPGNYTVSDDGDIYVGTNVFVRLNITASDFNPDKIFVAGVTTNEAGKLVGYLNGPMGQSVTLGTDDKTQSGRPVNLMFLGTTNCTSLSYKGNGDFTGVIYAPQADFHLAGGGSSSVDFCGSSVTRTVQMNGHYKFHYDENLRNVGPNNGYVTTSWKEY